MRNDNEYNDIEYVDIFDDQEQYEDISSDSDEIDGSEMKNKKPSTSAVIFEWVQSMMNAIIVVIILFTFMINELVYIPSGKYLPYFSEIGIIGFVLSNMLMAVPTIILKGHSMSKADVTEF